MILTPVSGQVLAFMLALLTGVSLGVLGGGGSIITLPVLVYVAGIEPKRAVGMALAIVGSTSLVGSWLHARHGNFYLRAAFYFGGAGIVGSYFGSTFTHYLPSRVLVLMFAVIMLIAGMLMLTRRSGGDTGSHEAHPPCSMQRFLLSGFGVGCLSGFLGVGGGFLIVPALVWFVGLDTKRAVGTSLAVIACNSASGLIGQLRYTHWDWPQTGEFVAISLVGMGLGVAVARRSPDKMLRKAFGVAVIAIALAMCLNLGRS